MIKIFAVPILIITFAAFFAPPALALAQSCRSSSGGYCVNLAAAVPGLEFLNLPQNPSIGDFIGAVYKTALGLVGISALIMVVVGGVMYLTAGDSTGQIAKAKSYMKNAIFGLVLAFLAWLILNTINPQLVQNLNLKLETISGTPSFSASSTISQRIQEQNQAINTLQQKIQSTGTNILFMVDARFDPQHASQLIQEGSTECTNQGGRFNRSNTSALVWVCTKPSS